jgi:hypothetical protein
LSASPIFGSFNIAGTIFVTLDSISWQGNDAPFPAAKAVIGPGATGSFAGLAGTTVTIHDLHSATAPVGSSFADTAFITFDAAPSLGTMEINFIFAGFYPSAGCLTGPPAVGQNCTPAPPLTAGASPFNFVNNPPGPPFGPQATATFVFTGDNDDNTSVWQGNFTSQFSVPFQTVLSAFGPGGSGVVQNTYSATFLVSTAVPEPEAMALVGLGLGLVLVSVGMRRRLN